MLVAITSEEEKKNCRVDGPIIALLRVLVFSDSGTEYLRERWTEEAVTALHLSALRRWLAGCSR
jgi:hypothetical protein